jgi:HEAT repeat protein
LKVKKEEIDRIAQGIWDTDPTVRLQAFQTLLQINDPAIMEYLNDGFDDETDIQIKRTLVKGLGNIKFEGVGAILLKAIHDEDAKLRQIAISSIIKCRDASILNKLVLFRNSPEAIPIEDELEEAIRVLTIPRGDPTKVKPPDKDRAYDYQNDEVDFQAHIKHYFEADED